MVTACASGAEPPFATMSTRPAPAMRSAARLNASKSIESTAMESASAALLNEERTIPRSPGSSATEPPELRAPNSRAMSIRRCW